jgi:hypothetical protein
MSARNFKEAGGVLAFREATFAASFNALISLKYEIWGSQTFNNFNWLQYCKVTAVPPCYTI